MTRIFVLLTIFALFAVETAQAVKTRYHFDDIQIGASRIKPTEVGWATSVSPNIAWTPLVDFDFVLTRGEFGFSWPSDANGSRFLSMNYQAFVMVPVWSLVLVEGGAGVQHWRYEGGLTKPILSVNIVLRAGEFIDRVYFGYSRFLFSGTPVNQFSSGLAINVFE